MTKEIQITLNNKLKITSMRENRIIKFRVWNGNRMEDNTEALRILYNLSCGSTITPSHYPIMQFTGLLDKNKKEIYEGDIVECGTGTYVVEFKEKTIVSYGHGDCGEELYIGFFIGASYGRGNQPIVIGNIYSNPELINK